MKSFIATMILLFLSSMTLAAEKAPLVYDGSLLTEDVTWSGTVLVKGFVVVSPQATLRIEPGTVVRFAASDGKQLPNLVVQGRIHAAGTADSPVVFTPDRAVAVHGAWGGIVLLATEKRNLLENCRIEYADTGLDIRFSTVHLKGASIIRTRTALLAHDGVVQISGTLISGAETGLEAYNSELDVKDTTIELCQRGCVVKKTAGVFVSTKINNNRNIGLEADECRLKISGGEFAGNASGARINGGDGRMTTSVFQKNSQTALHLSRSRMRIYRCQFSENSQDAVRVEDGWSLMVNNIFAANGGKNIYNAGSEAVSARQNWWNDTDASAIRAKIHDAFPDNKNSAVNTYPWLLEKPTLMP